MSATDELAALLRARPELQRLVVDELRALGYEVTPPEPPEPDEDAPKESPVPFVAIGAGGRAPWADEPLNCPTCGTGPLPLKASEGTSPIVLRYITHCGQSWMRGEVDGV